MFHGNLPSRLHLTRKTSGAFLLWLLHLRTYILDEKLPHMFSLLPFLGFSPGFSQAGCEESALRQRQPAMALSPLTQPSACEPRQL